MITLSCASCQKKLNVKDDLAGKKVRCPYCKQATDIPNGSLAIHLPAKPSCNEDGTVPQKPSAPAERNGDGADEKPRESLKAEANYEVEGEIARGGMGAIMKAVDQDIRREVAVKFLLNHADEKMKARFLEEAQITGQLEHPNIVPIHQLGVHQDGRCFFSMKMVKGQSLAEILKDKNSKYTLGRLLNIFVSICNAMAYAHSREVIHRDLKPANVMVGDFGEVYVMDWGLAKVLKKGAAADTHPVMALPVTAIQAPAGPFDFSTAQAPPLATPVAPAPSSSVSAKVATTRAIDGELTQAGAIMGTPAYMPPEQAKCKEVDQRADIYSLGAILYEIMTLTPPVGRGGDMLVILMRVVEGKIDPPQKRSPQRANAGWIPPELSAIALKALAMAPADRYQTVEALRRDVELFLEGRSVSAKQDTFREMAWKLVKRNKGVSVATAASLVVLVIVVVFFLKINYQARVEAENNNIAYLKEKSDKEKEQDDKRKEQKKSAPAFVGAARLLTADKQFAPALTQVNTALEFDPDQTEAYLLKGQLLIGLERYPEAVGPLREFVKRVPKNDLARQLADLAGKPEPAKPAYLWALWDVFDKQKAFPLAERMTHLVENLAGPNKELLTVYRKRIESTWPGSGNRLTIDKNGNLTLNLEEMPKVRDLSILKGMKLSSLNFSHTEVDDLEPLRDMPLTSLTLWGCHQVRDLTPLKGMKLTYLKAAWNPQLRNLEPLKDMPLTVLDLQACAQIQDLTPLKGMKLTGLNLGGSPDGKGLGARVRDLTPLRGMPLTGLQLGNCPEVRDIEPLKGMPLTWLGLDHTQVRDLEPLKGMKHLTDLYLQVSQVRNLEPLKGLQLNKLYLDFLEVSDLEPLKGMPLAHLNLYGCGKIRNLEPLKGMPLKSLSLEWSSVTDLRPLQTLQMETIHLTPRNITQGLDVLRGMKSLHTIGIAGGQDWPAAEFWVRYEKGEFKK
jgi:serine/threonine protein kinase